MKKQGCPAESKIQLLLGGAQHWSVAGARLQQRCGSLIQCGPFFDDPENIGSDYNRSWRSQDCWLVAAVSASAGCVSSSASYCSPGSNCLLLHLLWVMAIDMPVA